MVTALNSCRSRSVLPARAGVVRLVQPWRDIAECSPRASGGGPARMADAPTMTRFSPRERGWSVGPRAETESGGVLPARAGVVRSRPNATACTSRSPRASGGGPGSRAEMPPTVAFSPRERGGPMPYSGNGRGLWFSPRERGWSAASRGVRRSIRVLPVGAGWSADQGLRRGFGRVLPAQAGVVRRGTNRCRRSRGSPRTSGGSPRNDLFVAFAFESSRPSGGGLRRSTSPRPTSPRRPWPSSCTSGGGAASRPPLTGHQWGIATGRNQNAERSPRAFCWLGVGSYAAERSGSEQQRSSFESVESRTEWHTPTRQDTA
jgi:hypothetical protein